MNIVNGPLDDLELASSPYRYTSEGDLGTLDDSIADVGLLQPPIAAKGQTGRLIVVAGFRRVRACRRLGWRQAPVHVLPELPPGQIFKIGILSNACHRRLDPLECGRLCLSIQRHLTMEAAGIAQMFLPLMGQPSTLERLQLLSALPSLPELLWPWLATEAFPLKNVPGLLRFQPEDQTRLASVMVTFRLSSSRQREFLQQVWDVHRRDVRPVPGILKAIGALAPTEPGQDLPRICESICVALHRLAFPNLARHETAFKEASRPFERIPGVRLQPFPFFEKSECRLELVFDSPAALNFALLELSSPQVERAALDLFDDDNRRAHHRGETGNTGKRSAE